MAESEDYNAENEDYKRRGGETEITGDDVTGDEGLLEIEIPAARYGDGKVATAQDSDLIEGNIKKDVVIFGVTGTAEAATIHEGIFYPKVSGDDTWYHGGYFYGAEARLRVGYPYGTSLDHFSVRVPHIPIPAGATITEAFLRVTAESAGSGSGCNANCYFNAVDDADAPISAAEFTALSLGNAIAWSNIAAWTANSKYDTPELKTILQAIIDRDGWATGQALQVIIRNNASTSNLYRTAHSIDYSSGAYCPELHIKWTE